MLVKFFATYRQITGCKTCDVPAPGSVLALMEDLSERWPEFRDLILNEDGTDKGDDVIIPSGRTKVQVGDRVIILSLLSSVPRLEGLLKH